MTIKIYDIVFTGYYFYEIYKIQYTIMLAFRRKKKLID